jgi:hypothetical protein
LRSKFGPVVNYDEGRTEHLRTEFGFDVIQVARHRYAPQSDHDFIDFRVAKEQLERAFLRTQLIDHDQFHARPACQHSTESLFALCFDQLVDQRSSGRKSQTLPLAACRNGQSSGKVRFSGAGFTDQKDWFGTLQIAAIGQSSNARGRDVGRLRKVELLKEEKLPPPPSRRDASGTIQVSSTRDI